MKLGEDLKTWTGSTKSDKILGLTVWSETYEMTKFQKILELWSSVGW